MILSPGLFYEMWHKGVWGTWKTCGKPVENASMVPLNDADAGHAKYIGGALGRYITTGLEHPPLDTDAPPPGATDPADDLALRKYRGSGMPCWGEGRAP